jgi:outer membrane lipoprotein LolB
MALDGCAVRPPLTTPGVDWPARRERVAAIPAWEARGRIAIKAETGGGQGDLQWEQRGSEARIRVSGPFGAGAYEIRWNSSDLSVVSRNGEFARAYSGPDAAEQFLAEQLGWAFPAISSRFWLLGIPDPAFPAREIFSPDGQLVSMDQNGWTISYQRYVDQDGLLMPARMTVQNPRARVRLIIDRWRF